MAIYTEFHFDLLDFYTQYHLECYVFWAFIQCRLCSVVATMNGEYHLHNCERRLRLKRNDQMSNFICPIVNFPFICSNIAAAPAYWAYIFNLMWYSRVCDSYHSFINRGLLLTRTLLNEGPLVVRWSHHFENFTVAIMNWFTITEYMCHKKLRIRSVCRNYNPTLSSFMTYHRLINKSNTTDDTCWAGTAYLPRHMSSPLILVLFVLFEC